MDISADQIFVSYKRSQEVKAVSSNYSRFGVRLEANRTVLFKGDVFTEPSSFNIETPLSPLVEISDISLNGGGIDIVFKKN